MSLLTRMFSRLRSGSVHPPALPPAALRVTDEAGKVLADVPHAERADYRLCVALPSGTVTVDLYGHYQRFIDGGGKQAYHGRDAACHTYVKFGACIQDRYELKILIQPATQQGTT